jgi:Protein of unknown function (DUF4238)
MRFGAAALKAIRRDGWIPAGDQPDALASPSALGLVDKCMTKDHFVAQTYLRRFSDPSHKGMLHAYRKSNGKYFPCHPKDVCHEWDGDLNPLLVKYDLLGDFRKIFEPLWNASIDTLLSNTLSPTDMFAVPGYFANLMVCTPTWRRVAVKMYNDQARSFLIFSKKMQEKRGGNSELPVEAVEMLERGEITLEHDPNYIKAKVTQDLTKYAWMTYHQDWTIIRNATAHPFITSDNPVAIYTSSNFTGRMSRYLPITPALCLSVRYDRANLPPFNPAMPPKGKVNRVNVTDRGAKFINKLVGQCAEDLVFSSAQSGGIESLVRNCAKFRADAEFIQLPANEPDAVYNGTYIRVRDMRKGS